MLKKGDPQNIQAEKHSVVFREAYMKLYWEKLSCAGKDGQPLKIIIWGAGLATEWLHDLVQATDVKGPEIIAIVDDSSSYKSILWGKQVSAAGDVDFKKADAIFISTDTIATELMKRCKQYEEDGIRIIFPYADMPHGPYPM